MADLSDARIEEPSYTITLSERERQLRDKFVQEYLIDYDSTAAACRIGYPSTYAKDFGIRFLQETYVLQQIKLKETTPQEDENPDVLKKRILAGLLREANYRGPGSSQSARVAALAKLASMHGMDAPTRSTTEITTTGLAGVFLIPGLMTPEQWEAAAAAQQEALVNGTSATPAPKDNG